LIAGGIIAGRAAEVREAFARVGLAVAAERRREEWVSLVARPER
jgi:ribosomal protein L11 methylase PrmA